MSESLAGVFLLSSYIPLQRRVQDVSPLRFMILLMLVFLESLLKVATQLAAHLPLFWGHGKCDGQVKYEFALASAKQLASELGIRFQLKENAQTREDLEENGIDGLQFHTYRSLGHWIAPNELDDLAVWAAYLLPDVKL